MLTPPQNAPPNPCISPNFEHSLVCCEHTESNYTIGSMAIQSAQPPRSHTFRENYQLSIVPKVQVGI